MPMINSGPNPVEDAEDENDSREALEAAFDLHVEDEPTDDTGDVTPERKPTDEASEQAAPTGEPSQQLGAPPTTERAPQSWTPAEREGWAALPETARTAITKREQEHAVLLQNTAQQRQFGDNFNRMVQPFQQMFNAQGVDAMTGVRNVMQTASVLQSGNAQQRAQAVHQILRDFDVSVSMLDDLIVGQAPKEAPPMSAEMQAMSNQLAQQNQYIQSQRQREQQGVQQKQHAINAEVATFMNDPVNEFAHDLRPVMQQFMSMATQQGQQLSLKDCYNRALQTRPDLQTMVSNRKSSMTSQQRLAAARSAGSSVAQNSGEGGGPAAPDDVRGAIVEAMDLLG